MKEGVYIGDCVETGTYRIALCINKRLYFDSFENRYRILLETYVSLNIYRIQSYDSIMCGYFLYFLFNSVFQQDKWS